MRPKLWIAVVLAVVVYLFAHDPPHAQHLGGEYYNIAVALVDGRGYSDPFGPGTGPTAWQPPFYSLLLAGLLRVFGQRASVATAIVFFTIVSLTVIGVALFSIAERHRRALHPVWIVVFYVGWLWANYDRFFLGTHDTWLLTLIVGLMAMALSRYVECERLNRWLWGGLGGIAALTNPALAAAWLAVSVLICMWTPPLRRTAIFSVGVATCILAPWVARNALVFHEFIPSKSNLSYEAYLANGYDADGVYDRSTFLVHPFLSPQARYEYKRLGEMGFMQQSKRQFTDWLGQHPSSYVRKVATRALAATVVSMDPPTTSGRVYNLTVQMFYMAPFLALMVLLAFARNRKDSSRLAAVSATFCVVYLAPYVLVAFYARYRLPLTSFFCVLVFLALDRCALAYEHRALTGSSA